MDYAKFRSTYSGSKYDYDNVYGYQCVDLAKLWAKVGWKIIPHAVGGTGYAKLVFLNSNSMLYSKDVERIANQPKLVPPQGAIIVFDSAKKDGIGHIAIVDNATLYKVIVLEQNGGGSGKGTGTSAIRTHEYNYTGNGNVIGKVLGWLLPKPPKLPSGEKG